MLRSYIKWSLLFCVLFQFFIFQARTQQANVKVKISPAKENNNINSPILPVTAMAAVQIWPAVGEKTDSVLWEANMQTEHYYVEKFRAKKIDSVAFSKGLKRYHIDTTQKMCEGNPYALYVLVKHQNNLLKICLFKRYNPSLNKEVTLVYKADSLKTWTIQNCPPGSIPTLSINFPYCVGNKIIDANWDIRLIPFKTIFSYNDKRLNEMPLTLSAGKIKVAKVEDAEVYIYKQEYSFRDSNFLLVQIKEGGAFQKTKIINNFHYKRSYSIADTLVINSKLFKIDSIKKDWSYLYIRSLNNEHQNVQLTEKNISELKTYFTDSKNYLLLDFWGTWCGPCIKKLPALRELYEKHKSNINFLSVCVDSSLNLNKAKNIFHVNNITWPQIFNDINDSTNMAHVLRISCFPTYMVIGKKGNIVFGDCGTDGFIGLQKIISELPAD